MVLGLIPKEGHTAEVAYLGIALTPAQLQSVRQAACDAGQGPPDPGRYAAPVDPHVTLWFGPPAEITGGEWPRWVGEAVAVRVEGAVWDGRGWAARVGLEVGLDPSPNHPRTA